MSQLLEFTVDPKNSRPNYGIIRLLDIIPDSWRFFTMVLKSKGSLNVTIKKDSVCVIEADREGNYKYHIEGIDPVFLYEPSSLRIAEYRLESNDRGCIGVKKLIYTATEFLRHNSEYYCEFFSLGSKSLISSLSGNRMTGYVVSIYYSPEDNLLKISWLKKTDESSANTYEDPIPLLDRLRSLSEYGITEVVPVSK